MFNRCILSVTCLTVAEPSDSASVEGWRQMLRRDQALFLHPSSYLVDIFVTCLEGGAGLGGLGADRWLLLNVSTPCRCSVGLFITAIML